MRRRWHQERDSHGRCGEYRARRRPAFRAQRVVRTTSGTSHTRAAQQLDLSFDESSQCTGQCPHVAILLAGIIALLALITDLETTASSKNALRRRCEAIEALVPELKYW